MKKLISLMAIGILFLTGCGCTKTEENPEAGGSPSQETEGQEAEKPSDKNSFIQAPSLTQDKELPPKETVSYFYKWYIDYEGSPLLSGEYKKSEYLTGSLISKIEKELSESGGIIMQDPFTCKKDKPDKFSIESREAENEVIVREYFGDQTQPVKINLQKTGDKWQINEIMCINVEK